MPKFADNNRHASRLNAVETGLRRFVTYVSSAWAMASMPVSAVTRRGWVTVSSGSNSATRQVAFLSPQAILMCVLASEINANDCVSLPVPAVVGTAIMGSIGACHLAGAPVVLHPAAAGVDEVDSLAQSIELPPPRPINSSRLVAARDRPARPRRDRLWDSRRRR